jgi:hypothetical protein
MAEILNITTERVDDIPLLLAQLEQYMGDCKMGALATQAFFYAGGDSYLTFCAAARLLSTWSFLSRAPCPAGNHERFGDIYAVQDPIISNAAKDRTVRV